METPEFITFVDEIKSMIQDAQYQALRSVNRYRIELYWSIGKLIIEKQQQYNWGKKVVESLSFELQMEYPGAPGYSSANLWRMRNFYLAYQASEILAPLVREIGWAHNPSWHRLFLSKTSKKPTTASGPASATPILARYITTLCLHFYLGFLGLADLLICLLALIGTGFSRKFWLVK